MLSVIEKVLPSKRVSCDDDGMTSAFIIITEINMGLNGHIRFRREHSLRDMTWPTTDDQNDFWRNMEGWTFAHSYTRTPQ
jgi:hypothetical protein